MSVTTRRWLHTLGWLATLPILLWATTAIWFVHPAAGTGFFLLCGWLTWRLPRSSRTPMLILAAATVVIGWRLAIPARNDRAWEADVTEIPWAKIDGDDITLHNYRDFEWRTETDFTPRWETRRVRLSQLRQLDFIMAYWGSPHVCHTMLTFDFGPDGTVCASIEARREQGETYSALAGMFRRYELIYVLGAERDLVRLRTSVRAANEVFLFRLEAKPEVRQAMFLDYLQTSKALRERPAWYHSLLTNCSSTIRAHLRRAHVPDPWDWRVVANGHADERLYQFGYISRDLPFPELKRRSRIEPGSPVGETASEFSAHLRAGKPGF